MNNLPYYLALNRMERVGPRTVSKLLKIWPDLKQMFQLSVTKLEQAGVSTPLAQTIIGFDFNRVEADLNWLEAADDHHLLTWESPEYPVLLKEIYDPPIVLYAKGELSCLQKTTLAVVGSRKPTVTGIENARYFARALALHGIAIVSGLALGVDVQAHMGCLDAEGQTIAVLGTGIDRVYPYQHQKISQKIVQNGLLMSEFPLKSLPIARHFPRRNRIISGLSLCTLVVESAKRSGSLITARMALEQNRQVLAIPGSIHNPMAQGCHYLVQEGAKLVTSVVDVLEELRIDQSPQVTDKMRLPLVKTNEKLVKFIGFEMTTVDQIVLRSGCTVEQAMSELAELELNGTVVCVPGGYMRCI